MSDSIPTMVMKPEEFRHAALAHAEWVANYFARVRDFPVLPDTKPGDIIAALPADAPEYGESIEAIFRDFQEKIFPNLTLWNHPRFFAWFAVSSSPPAVLAELLAATVNVNAMLWKSSPAATELELVTLTWLRQWLGLNDEFFGILYDTASVSTMQAIGAARERADPECRTAGMRPGLVVYVSEQAHSSAEKAAMTLGFGRNFIRHIAVDDEFRMRPNVLEETIKRDCAAGLRPCCVVATLGTTSTASVDPLPEIAGIASRHGVWLHVDAAYGGSSTIVPERRYLLDGVNQADSFVINPHKGLFVPLDASVLYTRHPAVLRSASSLVAEYLKTAEDSQTENLMDYGIQLGRRFRALKLWYVFRYYGREGIVAFLRQNLAHAQKLREWIANDGQFEICAPVLFSLVCFRYRGDDALNQALLDEVNRSGSAFLSHTVLNGRYVLRFAIGNMQTTENDVRQTWELIRKTAAQLASGKTELSVQP